MIFSSAQNFRCGPISNKNSSRKVSWTTVILFVRIKRRQKITAILDCLSIKKKFFVHVEQRKPKRYAQNYGRTETSVLNFNVLLHLYPAAPTSSKSGNSSSRFLFCVNAQEISIIRTRMHKINIIIFVAEGAVCIATRVSRARARDRPINEHLIKWIQPHSLMMIVQLSSPIYGIHACGRCRRWKKCKNLFF